MALKKKSGGGGANWMDTYGDMVTLLLCFFVLLYSMSTISEENWKAIVQSFNPSAVLTPTATTGAGGPDADNTGQSGEKSVEEQQEDVEQTIQALMQAVQQMIQQDSLQEAVEVRQDGGKIYITFSQAVFFNGDSPVLRAEAYPILDEVIEMLDTASDSIDEVVVQGHTARVRTDPNRTVQDRTLASQRATNVIIYIQENGHLNPARLVSEGFGEWRPIADNSTSEGRAKNRRVEMIISGRNIQAEQDGEATLSRFEQVFEVVG